MLMLVKLPIGTATAKVNWFVNLLALLDNTVMLRDVLALLERIGPQLERPMNDELLAAPGRHAVAVPLSAEDKAALLDRLVSDLDAVANDRAGVLSEAEPRAVLIRLEGPAPQTLDPYYAELASLLDLFGAIAAAWMDRGETGKLDDLRRRVDEAFTPRPSVLAQDGAASQADYSRDEWQTYFETPPRPGSHGVSIGMMLSRPRR
jgi:hypothetical protein